MTILRLGTAPLALASLAAAPVIATSQGHGDPSPNIIVLVGDDLGWRDTGPYGNHFIRTPNIDRLARSGLRIAYSFGTTPQCSPSRIRGADVMAADGYDRLRCLLLPPMGHRGP